MKIKILLLFFVITAVFGCVYKKPIPLISQDIQSKRVEKYEWRQNEYLQQLLPIDYKFEQIYLKEIVILLMDLTGENYIIVDDLQGQVENVEISGNYNREEIINIVAVIVASKGYKIHKSDKTYIFNYIQGADDEKDKEREPEILRQLPKKNTYIYKLQYETTSNIKQVVNLLYDVKVDEVPLMNMLIIHSEQKEYEEISQLIKRFDTKPKQVLVEMTLLDVTLNNALKFGVEYFIRNNKTSYGNLSLLPEGISSGLNPLASGLKAISLTHQLDSIINLIKTETEVEIISKPKILVQDGKSSLIKIGRSEPIRRGTSVGSNNQTSENIDYRDTGIILNVTTKVNENNIVKLDISQEVSDIIKSAENPLINSPSFTTKNINISTLLKDGQSIYIGGLMENSESKLERKLPVLGSIPYLGKLFSTTDTVKKKTELILLVSISILTTEKDFENIRLKFVK